MGVRIKSINSYHPKNAVRNEYFLNYYKRQGIDISNFLKSCGRKNRYISDDINENILTMGKNAADGALEKANLNAKDINFIVFVSDTPEFLVPSNALKLHKAIDADKSTGTLDMNCNCLGMINALDNMSKMMESDKNMKYVLIVGAEQIQRYARKSDPATFANFGDAACAVILEKTDDDNSGVIDSTYFTDSYLDDNIEFPLNGFSTVLPTEKSYTKDEKVITWKAVKNDEVYLSAIQSIEKLLDKNNLKSKDIKGYFLSQMSKSKLDEIREELNETDNKFPYIGDEYGYTGVTSPFLALESYVNDDKLKRGDNILFWSLAAGIATAVVLVRY